MSLELLNDLWGTITSYIDTNDRKDFAYDVVTMLIDFNYEPDEIREYLGTDRHVSKALKEYALENDDGNDDDEFLDGMDLSDTDDWDN